MTVFPARRSGIGLAPICALCALACALPGVRAHAQEQALDPDAGSLDPALAEDARVEDAPADDAAPASGLDPPPRATHEPREPHEPLRRAALGARARVHAEPPAERAQATSDYTLELGALADVPRRRAEQYLTLAPGVVLGNHAGEGHASSVFLRGFDAGEGQDLEVTVDGVPINEPSSAHGHGYADASFVVPEAVRALRVIEGPFDARQGDFAVAGSAHYELGVGERGLRASLGYGSYAEKRGLLLWAPTGASEGTFAALELRDGSGFGPSRAHASASALGRYAHDRGPVRYALLAAGHALTFDSAGLIRKDALDARALPCPPDRDSQRLCAPDPNQGGAASRALLSGRLAWRTPGRALELQAFAMRRGLRVRENFTGSALDARGDGLDEGYEATTLGGRGAFVLTPHALGHRQRVELGYVVRHDAGRTRMWRLRHGSAIPYATVFDSELALTHVGGYVSGELTPLAWLTLRAGARADAFGFSIVDLDRPSSDRVGERLPVDARDAWGTALSPRGALAFHLTRAIDLTASAGVAVRSSDAQALSEGEAAPFARAVSLELGPRARLALGEATALEARAATFTTRVESDLLFDPERGRNVPIGPSHRYGATVSGRLQFARAFDTLASVTWTEAHAPAPSSRSSTSWLDLADGPRLPFVPRLVARLDHAARAVVRLSAERVVLGGALGAGYIGPRPLPLGAQSDAALTIDASVRARVRGLELALSIENLLDADNHAFEAFYASDFSDPTESGAGRPASLRAARHVAVAPPRLFMLTLTAYLDDLMGDDS